VLRGPHEPYGVSDQKIALAAALGRSRFAANPLMLSPFVDWPGRQEDVLGIRAQLMKRTRY
jgi:hypothetical protein